MECFVDRFGLKTRYCCFSCCCCCCSCWLWWVALGCCHKKMQGKPLRRFLCCAAACDVLRGDCHLKSKQSHCVGCCAVLCCAASDTHLLWHELPLLHELLNLLPQLTAAVHLISQQVACSRQVLTAVAAAASNPLQNQR